MAVTRSLTLARLSWVAVVPKPLHEAFQSCKDDAGHLVKYSATVPEQYALHEDSIAWPLHPRPRFSRSSCLG